MKRPTEGDNVKRVVIVKEGYFTIFEQLAQSKLLKDLVSEVCVRWSLQDAEQYALQNQYTKIYVTEENRSELHDGDILTVTLNFELAAAKSLSDIEQKADLSLKRQALVLFTGIDGAGQADDPQFAKEFIRRSGINTLVKIIESSVEPADVVAQAIAALQELMEHNFTSWDTTVNQDFVKKILSFANKTDGLDRKIIQRSLSLLEHIVSNSSFTLYILVMNEVKLANLVYHIKRDDAKLQLSAVTLCNSVFMRMEHANRKKFAKELSSKGYTEVLQKILASSYTSPLSNEMLHQLYVYQSLLLSLMEPRMMSRPNTNDPDVMMQTLNAIYTVAFESSASRGQTTNQLTIDFKNLGFLNGSSPLMDFEECPPGVLAYDAITYFARKHQDQYVKMILENSVREKEYECPFARCSQQVVKMLCELLSIGSPISETSTDIQPMFFTSGDIFEELFSVSILLLNKTWKEMKATTTQDLPKVLGIVKDQISRALNEKPDSVEKLKTKAFSLSYQQVIKLKQQEAQERTILDSKSKPVMELRESIEPEIKELVRQQRLAQLVNGQKFTHFSTKGKAKQDRQWFCCLSPNYRFLYYGNISSNENNPSVDKLQSKIALSDVTSIEVGKDAPHSKALKKGISALAFSLMYNQEDHLDFVAENPEIFSVWTDALLSLTGKEMKSKEFQDDLDMLLNMEMKLLLLDLEDVRIPETPPEIPREPDNYNFYYRDE